MYMWKRERPAERDIENYAQTIDSQVKYFFAALFNMLGESGNFKHYYKNGSFAVITLNKEKYIL